MRRLIAALAVVVLWSCQPRKEKAVPVAEEIGEIDLSSFGPKTLSSYGLFEGELKKLAPAKGVHSYDINAPLFSDYALKKRFIKVPTGQHITYDPAETFSFPEGTVLIKNFYYPVEMRKPDEALRLLETRLLILRDGQWSPLTYVWNEEQTEAYLVVSGESIPVTWTHTDGVLRRIDYSVPNLNQCKGCHLKGNQVMPIGPSARQLNRGHQLEDWHSQGLLAGLPEGVALPKLVAYDDLDQPVADRARAWLEVNCAHCHRPDGPAKNSGLHLNANVTSPAELGVGKAPVAAGQGSGGRRYSIVPGKPDESILLYRIESMDPGVMMPEMGRKLVHKEGVELVRRWIEGMR